ncbi:MAG: RNA methyltransferase [Pseudomonadales bacterium]|nr:RNA methyltransferase [Pseudomonadales bacterium]
MNKHKNRQFLTIYGRKACEEALQDSDLNIKKLHLADSNKPASILRHCLSLAEQRGVEVTYHSKRELSFISKNSKQDQGIALDILSSKLNSIESLDTDHAQHIVLLDNITNPQNIGMIIRSIAAGFIDGLIIPEKGCAALGPLVIKASSGTIFKCPIYRCRTIEQALEAIKPHYRIASLDLAASVSLFDYGFDKPSCLVLGNESTGVSQAVQQAAQARLRIGMNNQVESLNVAVTAALIAFHPALRQL